MEFAQVEALLRTSKLGNSAAEPMEMLAIF